LGAKPDALRPEQRPRWSAALLSCSHPGLCVAHSSLAHMGHGCCSRPVGRVVLPFAMTKTLSVLCRPPVWRVSGLNQAPPRCRLSIGWPESLFAHLRSSSMAPSGGRCISRASSWCGQGGPGRVARERDRGQRCILALSCLVSYSGSGFGMQCLCRNDAWLVTSGWGTSDVDFQTRLGLTGSDVWWIK